MNSTRPVWFLPRPYLLTLVRQGFPIAFCHATCLEEEKERRYAKVAGNRTRSKNNGGFRFPFGGFTLRAGMCPRPPLMVYLEKEST